jgi:hypothetical protein
LYDFVFLPGTGTRTGTETETENETGGGGKVAGIEGLTGNF